MRPTFALGGLALAVLVAGSGLALALRDDDPPAVRVRLAAAQRGPVTALVSAAGNTVDGARRDLAFGSSGPVTKVYVKVGTKVTKGQVLARIDGRGAREAYAAAKADLSAAQQSLTTTTASSTGTTGPTGTRTTGSPFSAGSPNAGNCPTPSASSKPTPPVTSNPTATTGGTGPATSPAPDTGAAATPGSAATPGGATVPGATGGPGTAIGGGSAGEGVFGPTTPPTTTSPATTPPTTATSATTATTTTAAPTGAPATKANKAASPSSTRTSGASPAHSRPPTAPPTPTHEPSEPQPTVTVTATATVTATVTVTATPPGGGTPGSSQTPGTPSNPGEPSTPGGPSTAEPPATARPSTTAPPSATARPTTKPTAKATAKPHATASARSTGSCSPGTTSRDTTARTATTPKDGARGGITEDQAAANVDRAEAALEEAADAVRATRIVAPTSGTVLSVAGRVGDTAGTGTFISLGNLNELQVQAMVTESDVNRLKLGQQAAITLATRPGERHGGTVTAIAPTATVEDRLVRYSVTLAFDEPPAGLMLGQTATVSVTTAEAKDAIYVPAAAVRSRSDGAQVVTVRSGGHDAAKVVGTGVRGDQYVQITSGLDERDQVVMSGTTTGEFPDATWPGA
ncbi:efflux RND transporter periplasmic adaptor subunit [Nonomuraea sp. NPDC050227]|uniref:efflux RND transporter periplasmic adaptor subunit n=1 Tax=Nonomuraea sp. NPDC050227 TaxID=3364360 RepID=UPI00379280E8